MIISTEEMVISSIKLLEAYITDYILAFAELLNFSEVTLCCKYNFFLMKSIYLFQSIYID